MKTKNELEMKRKNELKMNGELKMTQEKNVEMNITFKAIFNTQEIAGYMYLSEADDEHPLRFYDRNNQEQWQIPSNPHDIDSQYPEWANYDYLTTIFQETDIVGLLCDYVDEQKTIILEETIDNQKVILKIND